MIDLQTEKVGSVTVARVTGNLNGTGEETFEDQVIEFVSEGEARLILDLAGLESIDSSGLSSLINIAARARMRGGDVSLVAPNAFVSAVLSVTRLDNWFSVHESVDAARAALEGS